MKALVFHSFRFSLPQKNSRLKKLISFPLLGLLLSKKDILVHRTHTLLSDTAGLFMNLSE